MRSPLYHLMLPLGTTRPLVKDFAPLICRIERCLSASSVFFNYAGRLQLVHLIWSTYYISKVQHLVSTKGSFWWKDVLSLNTIFRGIATCSIGTRDTLGLGEDCFLDQNLSHKFLAPHAYTKNGNLSLQVGCQTPNLLICSDSLSSTENLVTRNVSNFCENK